MKFDLNTINPYIRVAMRSILSKGTEIYRRIIFDYELLYVEAGEFLLSYAEKDYKCTSGQFVLLRPGISHRFYQINGDLSQPHIHFDMVYSLKSLQTPVCFFDLPKLSEREKELIVDDIFVDFPQSPFIIFRNMEEALSLFYDVIDTPDDDMLKKKARLTELIGLLIRDNFPELLSREQKKHEVAQQLKDCIDSGNGLLLSLEDFEKRFSYSKYYLERQFKKQYSVGVISYRNKKRMEFAAQMLKTRSVSAVASELGFSSVYVFSRAFKNYYGVCPSKQP